MNSSVKFVVHILCITLMISVYDWTALYNVVEGSEWWVDLPFFLGNNEYIIEQEEVVALMAEGLPEDPELLRAHGQLASL